MYSPCHYQNKMKQKSILLLIFVFFSHFILDAQQWDLMTPLRVTTDVRGCSFLNDQHGFAVATTDGIIMESTDGGMTWNRPWAPQVNGNLYDINFVSPDTIYTCGSNGGLYRSIDAANSWVDLNPPSGEYLYGLHFIDTQIGFACGMNGTILRTQNGGDTWTLIPSGTTSRLWDIEFVDANIGFIAGWNGTILKTVDAGLTWNLLNTATSISFMHLTFPTDQIGYACGANYTIYKTIDGGVSWTSQITGGSNTLNYIFFRNATIGWAVGDWGALYTTTNGGSTWNTATTLGNTHLYCGAYINNNASFVMGTSQIYKSTNNGSLWTLVKNGVPRMNVHSLWFLNNNSGSAAGAVGVVGSGSSQSGIVQTTNGGQTWAVRQQGSSNGWYGIHFPNANNGFVVGGNNFGKTSNGGVNWTFTTPVTAGARGCWFLDADNGVVGGDGSGIGICKTDNAGSSFNCTSNMFGAKFYFVNDELGFGIGSGTTENIFKTTDGGDTWDYWPTGFGVGKFSIHFLDENIGWLGIDGGTLRTTDGGLTWDISYLNAPVVGIRFFTPTNGFCVTQNNDLYSSNDGGVTWTIMLSTYITMSGALTGFFTDDYCYIGSSQGDIYRASLGCGPITAGPITGPNDWCENQTGYFAVPQIAGAVSYQWTLPEGWTGSSNSQYIAPIASATNGLVSVTITNGCGETSTAQYNVTVTPAVQELSSIIGPEIVCSNADNVFSIPVDANATEYIWQHTVGLQVIENNNEITILEGSGSGSLFVHTSNACGISQTISLDVNIQNVPNIEFDLSDSPLCPIGIMHIENQDYPGLCNGPALIGNEIDLSQLSPGTHVYTCIYAAGGCSVLTTDSIQILSNEISYSLLSGPDEVCEAADGLYAIENVVNATNIEWMYPLDWDVQVLDENLIVNSYGQSGTILVTMSNECEGEATTSKEVIVQNLPISPVYGDNPTMWCAESMETISLNPPNAQTDVMVLFPLELSVITDDINTYEVYGPAGEYTIEIYNSNACGNSETILADVTILSLPTVSLEIESTICDNEIYFPVLSPAGGVLSGPGVVGNSIDGSLIEVESANYTYQFIDEFGCLGIATDEVIVDNCTSITELNSHNILIFPNPISNEGELKIISDLEIFRVDVIDITGKVLVANLRVNTNGNIHMPILPPGLYQLICYDKMNVKVGVRVVVE